MAAASALMLTACTSEDEVLQSSAPQKVEAKAVGFDVYMPQVTNVTRAGDPKGVMTTDKLKTEDNGFGVFAMYTGADNYATATYRPNFMFNEHVSWNGGWTYSPLKYWPNETTNDSQTPTQATMPDLEKLSFFAYAPYVNLTTSGDLLAESDGYIESTPSTGILAISKETRKDDPLVKWKNTTDLDKNVDLLWGVAPAGMDYTSVKGTNVSTTFGKPLVNLVKPDKDQKIKFLFQHALSRMSISVVSAIDQIAAGDDGGKFDPDQTRVLIENVEIFGDFSTEGVLNLNNTKENVANWVQTSIVKSTSKSSSDGTPLITLDQSTNKYLSSNLRYVTSQISAITGTADEYGVYPAGSPDKFAELNRGVRPSESVLLSGAIDADKALTSTPTFAFGKSYYIADETTNCVLATAKTANNVKVYSKDASGNYTLVYSGSGSGDGYKVDGTETNLVMLTGDAATVDAGTTIDENHPYWTLSDGVFKKVTTGTTVAGTHYQLAESTFSATYSDATYYSAPLPRYFMFAPTKTGDQTTIGVKITYHVVTKDTKLNGNISDVRNIVTKTIPLTMESGKSYNLKLILGLTSVKLDATVGEWQVGDDAEIWLPQNVE